MIVYLKNNSTGGGYSARTESLKWVFVQAVQRDARRIVSAALLEPRYRTGVETMELTHNDMRSLYDHFTGVPDVRRAKGRKHKLANVLALAAGATLSGMRGYKDIWVWASTLSEASRTRFRCRFRNRRREVPSLTVIRNVMIQVGRKPWTGRSTTGWLNTTAMRTKALRWTARRCVAPWWTMKDSRCT